MRTIIEKTVVNIGATAITSELQPGARNEGWRLWDGILRCVADGGDVTVTLRATMTGETIESVSVAAGAPKSSNLFKIPGAYDVTVTTTAVGNATVSIYLDGDTGVPPATVTIS